MQSPPDPYRFIAGYAEETRERARGLVEAGRAEAYLAGRYPERHEVRNNAALVDYVQTMKRKHLRQSDPLSKVCFSDKLSALNKALGTHTYVSRVQGGKLKAKNELRVASLFKEAPAEFLRMIVVGVNWIALMPLADHTGFIARFL